MVRRACTVVGCLDLSDGSGSSHCVAHEAERVARKRERRASAPGDGAAKRLRSRLSSNPWHIVVCAACSHWRPARGVEVDHIVPLGAGGHDVESNLQLLCPPCHRTKTASEQKQYAGHAHAVR